MHIPFVTVVSIEIVYNHYCVEKIKKFIQYGKPNYSLSDEMIPNCSDLFLAKLNGTLELMAVKYIERSYMLHFLQ